MPFCARSSTVPGHVLRVAVAEADYQDLHQRSVVEVAAAAASEHVVVETLDAVERFIWSLPGLEVIGATRKWLDYD